MPASIVVNQATLSAGVAGKARSDGVISELVTCSNATVEASYLWTLVDVPIRSALVRGATGVASTFTFTPDVKGTYLVTLRVNGSSADVDNAETYLAIRSFGSKTLSWRYKAASETLADNETYVGLGFPSNTNPRGWATDEDLVYEEVEESTWETQNAITSYSGLNERIVKTNPLTGKVDASLIAGTAPTGAASGDLSGSYPNPSVVKLRGREIANPFTPTDGQTIWWNNSTSKFELSSGLLLTSSAATFAVSAMPAADATYNLGSASMAWADIYAASLLGGPGASTLPGDDVVVSAGKGGAGTLVDQGGRGGSVEIYSGVEGDDNGGGPGLCGDVVIAAPYIGAVSGVFGDQGVISVYTGAVPTAPNPGSIQFASTNDIFALATNNLSISAENQLTIYGGKAGTDAILLDAFDATGAISLRTATTERARITSQGIRVVDGSTTSPSISGMTDATSGLSFTTNATRFLIGGSRGAELTSTGLSLREVGSAGTPSFRNLTHSQTGIFWPDTESLGITTQGIEAARFKAALNNPTGDEVAATFTAEINKSTSGNYTLIKGVVTETSAPGSSDRLIDMQVGGVSQFIVDNAGTVFIDSGTAGGPGLRFTADGNSGYFWVSNGITAISGGGLEIVRFSAVGGATPQILGATSGASAPVYSFASDSNTGMYRNAENVLGFATSGVDRLLISTTVMQPAVVINGISGSAGSPPFSFSADPDTGMFRAGADNIGWSVGGNQRLGLTNTALLPSGTVNLGSNSLAFDEVWHNETYLIDTTNAELSDTTVVGNVTTSAGTTTTVKVVGLKANRAMILEVRCVAIKNGGPSDSYAEHCAVRAVADGVGAVTLQSATGTKMYQNRAGTIVKSEVRFSAPNPFEVNVDAYNDVADPGLKWSLTITWRQVSA